jgi:hypothetical protein
LGKFSKNSKDSALQSNIHQQLKIHAFLTIARKRINDIQNEIMEVKIEKLRGQLRGRILSAIFLLKDMGIYPDEIVEHNIFRTEAFSRGKVAIDFFRAVKEGDIA